MFPKAIPTSWVVRSVASNGKSLENLLPFEFGIFDKDTHLSLAAGTVRNKRNVYFAVGSPNQKQFTQGSKPERLSNVNNADVTFRTDLVPTVDVDTLRYQTPKKTESPNVYYLGYNGLGVCETLKFECGKTYMFHVEVKGRPVRNIFQQEMREIIEFSTDCCDSCTQTGCDTGEDCHLYIDALVDKFNKESLWVSRFFTASKVVSCADALPTLTQTDFIKWKLTVCDNGDEIALSKVQNQYPDNKVEVIARHAPYTTYQIVLPDGDTLSDFTQTNLVFVDECGDCPSGYTSTPSGAVYLVEVSTFAYEDNFDTDEATTLEVLLGLSTGDLSDTGYVNTISIGADKLVFYIIVPDGGSVTVDSVVNNGVTATSLGSKPATCQSDTVSTTWVQNGTCYKVQRDLCVTVGSAGNCDDPSAERSALLAEVTDFLNGYDNYVTDSIDYGPNDDSSPGCVVEFTISQYNNAYLESGCDTEPQPVFDVMPLFKGQPWKVCNCDGWTVNEDTGCPEPPVADTNCCQCGIKFETKPTNVLLDNFAGYDFNTYLEKDPVELVVTRYRDDDETRVCDYVSPSWLHAKRATFRQLRGDDVIKRIITERFYNQEPWVNQTNKENLLFLQREGIKLGVDIQDFYYAIDVYYNEKYVQNTTTSHSNRRNCVTLFVNENDAETLTTLKELLATSFDKADLENW